MKLSKFASLLVIGLVLTLAASGCKKKPGAVTPLPGNKAGQVGDIGSGKPIGSETGGDTKPLEGTPMGNIDEITSTYTVRDEKIFEGDRVFFAYDSAVIRASEKSKIAKVADYWKSNPGHALEVDGHCDERGTEEYNRSLGERRAQAAREELIRLGVDGSKVITKSFGKDRPIEPLHSEAAWSKNRRDEFVLLSKP